MTLKIKIVANKHIHSRELGYIIKIKEIKQFNHDEFREAHPVSLY